MNHDTPPSAPLAIPEVHAMAKNAAEAIERAANETGYSLLELSALFRSAAQMCDEQAMLLDKAAISRRFRNGKF